MSHCFKEILNITECVQSSTSSALQAESDVMIGRQRFPGISFLLGHVPLYRISYIIRTMQVQPGLPNRMGGLGL